MAYNIKVLKETEADKDTIYRAIMTRINESRFLIDLSANMFGVPAGMNYMAISPKGRFKAHFAIVGVRLREKKGYCGNHCGPCRLTGRKHKKMKYLEGADWVSFNDMINDVLDELNVSANVFSSHCIVRKGPRRRMCYYGESGLEFYKDADREDYSDRRLKGHEGSDFDWGTPGFYGWKPGSTYRAISEMDDDVKAEFGIKEAA